MEEDFPGLAVDCHNFYACYLLKSSKAKASFYIGSTPDPVRRLRQHNGLLKHGGAWRTKPDKYRPWIMICLISGFQSRVAALQFEHAWQHTWKTRHIKPDQRLTTSKGSNNRSLAKILGNLRLLGGAPAFKRLPLTISMFEESVYNEWLKNKYKIESSIPIHQDFESKSEPSLIGGGRLVENLKKGKSNPDNYVEKSLAMVRGVNSVKCGLSSEDLDVSTTLLAFCSHTNCEYVCSLSGLAQRFLEDQMDNILPIGGTCPGCGGYSKWNAIAYNSARVQRLLNAPEEGQGRQDEDNEVISAI